MHAGDSMARARLLRSLSLPRRYVTRQICRCLYHNRTFMPLYAAYLSAPLDRTNRIYNVDIRPCRPEEFPFEPR